ncbi:MAG: AzlD domain-containing protein [Coriobacteriia bacterium]|nr:AzlD domain-containing protein [Coriobacteriia bacterium]
MELSPVTIYLLILGLCLANFALRFIPLAVVSRLDIPRPIIRWLSYMPVAVMGALVAVEVVIPAVDTFRAELQAYQAVLPYAQDGGSTPDITGMFLMPLPGVLGALTAMLVYRYTKSFIGATLAGIAVFALLQLLLGT